MRDEDTLDSAEQRLMHGLLADLHASGREAPLRLAMGEARAPAGSRLGRAAAALAFMAAGAVLAVVLSSRLPEAQAVLDRASREAGGPSDRQYRVSVVSLKRPAAERVASGTLHVRGSEAFAIQFDAVFGKGWYGSDGRKTWFEPAAGRGLEWSAPQEDSWKDRNKLDFVRFDSFLRSYKDRYDVVTIGREDGQLVIRATRKLDLPGEPISQFDIRVAEKSGVMTRLQYRMDPELWHWDPWLVSVELAGESPHPPDFYTFGSKNR